MPLINAPRLCESCLSRAKNCGEIFIDGLYLYTLPPPTLPLVMTIMTPVRRTSQPQSAMAADAWDRHLSDYSNVCSHLHEWHGDAILHSRWVSLGAAVRLADLTNVCSVSWWPVEQLSTEKHNEFSSDKQRHTLAWNSGRVICPTQPWTLLQYKPGSRTIDPLACRPHVVVQLCQLLHK